MGVPGLIREHDALARQMRRQRPPSRPLAFEAFHGVARSASSPLDFADGTRVAGGVPAAAVVIPANASCALSSDFEGPTSLRVAFSLTPNRCAIARLLIPWLFSISMLHRRFLEIRRRPRRQPSSPPSAAIPPCA